MALFAIIALPVASFATSKFFDCGPGWVVQSAKNRDGISAMECKRLYCRDLENGKAMGTEARMNNGYHKETELTHLEDNEGNSISCFGQRKWCVGQVEGVFDPDFGMYVRGGDGNAYRGILKGDCWEWQPTNHSCRLGETPKMDPVTGTWVCIDVRMGLDTRSAIKARATRRTSGMLMPGVRKR